MSQSKRDESSKPSARVELPQGEVRLVHNPFAAHFGRGDEAKLEQRMADAPEAIAPRASSRLVVRRERAGRGGKVVTIVEGEPLRGCELPALAKDLARAMGTGARVESGTLVLQGEQIERVVAWLVSRGLGPIVVGN